MPIGNKISEIRKQKGMKISVLSEISGVPIGTLKKILTGVTKYPQLDTIQAIAAALDCKIDDFDDHNSNKNQLTQKEQKMVEDYRKFDEYGKKAVDAAFMVENERHQNQKTGIRSHSEQTAQSHTLFRAAHSIHDTPPQMVDYSKDFMERLKRAVPVTSEDDL